MHIQLLESYCSNMTGSRLQRSMVKSGRGQLAIDTSSSRDRLLEKSTSRSTTSHADDTLRLSALTTLNLEDRRLSRVASHISELCLRLHRFDVDSTTFVIDTNFRYAAPPMATGSRQPMTSDVTKLTATALRWKRTAQMSGSASLTNENTPTQTGSSPTMSPVSQQTATTVITKRRVSRSRDRAIVARATLVTLPLRCFQLSANFRLVNTHLYKNSRRYL